MKRKTGTKKFKPTVFKAQIKKLTSNGKTKLTKEKKSKAMKAAWR